MHILLSYVKKECTNIVKNSIKYQLLLCYKNSRYYHFMLMLNRSEK